MVTGEMNVGQLRGRIPELDGIRGLAILMVLVCIFWLVRLLCNRAR